ncbi:Galactose-1-phosphate uridylyltransferase [Bacillus sp. OV322]|uniref:DUF4931 domain-containing protein n=1 Tax=Bacillus sp. OV322 TaxID=1882764 RepID=UPI0008E071F6|nr:DUF4931 domain-containing protein [Bacillus sp. OV322]SFC71751.1 Galactose-1-phosphate uridylyltransferase [Bacillus sp. OV322]
MDHETTLSFEMQIGRQKPSTIRNKQTSCPFCNTSDLENIIDREGDIILLENKFPTLKNTFQTVLIETNQCNGEFSDYPREHLHKLMRFAFRKWEDYEQSGNYKSVLLFKNHGPYSGGTISHPHMQIVGLKHVDYKENISNKNFEGTAIFKTEDVEFNISTNPIMGFYEFNVSIQDIKHVEKMADCLQNGVHYLKNHFRSKIESYNLFFYKINGSYKGKIVPRYVASPYFVGYKIPQVSNDIDVIANQVTEIYFRGETSSI